MIDRVGLVLLSQVGPTGSPLGQAIFVELGSELTASTFDHPFGAAVGTCMVGLQRMAANALPAAVPSAKRLTAGSITISAGGAGFGTMTGPHDGTYELTDATGPLPNEGVTLSVSASESFPAFPSVSIHPATAPVLDAAFDPADVRLGSEFAWQPGEPGSAVLLMGHGDGVSFSCMADDSAGSFVFPEETKARLSSAGFVSGTLNTVGRMKTVQAVNGGAHLLLGTVQLAVVGDGR